jgi:autotransporter-associated beta strand protein
MTDKSVRNNPVRRLKLAALGSVAAWLALAPGQAWASCALAPGGTGTVANPGPNSTVVCTGTTSGINVATTSAGAQVQIESGAQVNGVIGSSEIFLDGGSNRVTIGDGSIPGPAALRDTNVVVSGSNAELYVQSGSLVDLSGDPLLQINVTGASAVISISGGSQVIVPRPIALSGGNGSFYLDSASILSAAANFSGSQLIVGDTGNQTFNIAGTVEASDANPVARIIDSGDGDDNFTLTADTRFIANASAASRPTFLLDGGAGNDTLNLDNVSNLLEFNSVGIETLISGSGASGLSTLRGVHEFQEIRVLQGQLDVFGEAALGAPGAYLNILSDGRLRFFGTGSQQLTQSLTGGGVFEYAAGTNEFATANTNGGEFIISGGAPVISYSGAFGSALVTNTANVILRDVAITNVLTGNGNYIIDGTATSLGATNRMTGTITVQSGALRVTDFSHLGSGQVATPAAIVINAPGTLNFDVQSDGTLENALSGSGAFNRSGAANLTIDRSNAAYSGQVNLQGGRTFVNASDALGTGTIRFSGGFIDFTNTSDIVISNAITSAPGATAVFEKNGAGRTTLTGDNSGMTALFALNQGIVAVNSVTGLGAAGSNATLGGSAGLEISNSADETLGLRVTNVIPSIGTFRKLGAGRLTVVDLFQVGSLFVDAGSLRVDQTITAASAAIASGARLGGTGRIIGNLTNNGTVAPGNSIGTLTVEGNYVHNAGSLLEIEFDGSGGIDLLDVTGNVTLNGGTLRFVSLGNAEGSGGTFLRAGGTLTGTFAMVETAGAQLPLAVIYQPSSALMAPSVLTARPSTFNAQFLAGAETGLSFLGRARSALIRRGEGTELWLEGFAADGKRSANGQTLAYGHDVRGIGGGMTMPLGERLTLGVSAGWARGEIDLAQNGGAGDQNSLLGAVSMAWQGRGMDLAAGVLLGKVDQETLRNVSFNGFAASVSGSTESNLLGVYGALALPLGKLAGWSLGGTARISWIKQRQDAYSESGTSPLRLTLGKLSAETLETEAGLLLTRHLGGEDRGADLAIGLGARWLGLSGDRAIPVSFASSNAAVTLQGDTRDALHAMANVNLAIALGRRAWLELGYGGQLGSSDRHEGRLGVRFGF